MGRTATSTEAEAQAALDEVLTAIRAGTFDARCQARREVSPMSFHEFADIYKERRWREAPLVVALADDARLAKIGDEVLRRRLS